MIHHDDFKTSSDDFVELYAVKRYLKATEEGSPDYFFDHPNTELADEEEAPQALPQVVEDAHEWPIQRSQHAGSFMRSSQHRRRQ